jgi:hypothetical protein
MVGRVVARGAGCGRSTDTTSQIALARDHLTAKLGELQRREARVRMVLSPIRQFTNPWLRMGWPPSSATGSAVLDRNGTGGRDVTRAGGALRLMVTAFSSHWSARECGKQASRVRVRINPHDAAVSALSGSITRVACAMHAQDRRGRLDDVPAKYAPRLVYHDAARATPAPPSVSWRAPRSDRTP